MIGQFPNYTFQILFDCTGVNIKAKAEELTAVDLITYQPDPQWEADVPQKPLELQH